MSQSTHFDNLIRELNSNIEGFNEYLRENDVDEQAQYVHFIGKIRGPDGHQHLYVNLERFLRFCTPLLNADELDRDNVVFWMETVADSYQSLFCKVNEL